MTGGTLIIDGNAGNEIGLSMQGGAIAIGGEAGDMLGFNMTDGTILVIGNCGIRAGAGMHGGTIGLFGPEPPPVLPSFRFDRTTRPEKLQLALHAVRQQGLRVDESLLPDEVDVYIGDLVAEGNGEFSLRRLPS
jgi:formylmethanofuran dehydrogenase subunit C